MGGSHSLNKRYHLGDRGYLVYTAVYRLQEMVDGMWFKAPAPTAILLGGVMDMVRFGITKGYSPGEQVLQV